MCDSDTLGNLVTGDEQSAEELGQTARDTGLRTVRGERRALEGCGGFIKLGAIEVDDRLCQMG